MNNLDRHFAQLVLDHLSTDESIEAGVPSATVLPRVLAFPVSHDMTALQLVFSGTSEDSGRTSVVTVVCTIVARMDQEQDADALSAMQQSIIARLADVDAWYDYLADLDESQRTGFQILKYLPPESAATVLSEDRRELQLAVAQKFSILRF